MKKKFGYFPRFLMRRRTNHAQTRDFPRGEPIVDLALRAVGGGILPDGHPAPDLTPNQSGIPAEEFRERLRKRIHAEDISADDEDVDPEYEDIE